MEPASKTGLGTILGGLLCDRSYCYCIRDSGGVAEDSARRVESEKRLPAVPIPEIPHSPLKFASRFIPGGKKRYIKCQNVLSTNLPIYENLA